MNTDLSTLYVHICITAKRVIAEKLLIIRKDIEIQECSPPTHIILLI